MRGNEKQIETHELLWTAYIEVGYFVILKFKASAQRVARKYLQNQSLKWKGIINAIFYLSQQRVMKLQQCAVPWSQ